VAGVTEIQLIASVVIAIMKELTVINPYDKFGNDRVEVDYFVEDGVFKIIFFDENNDFDEEWLDRVAMTFVNTIVPKGFKLQVALMKK